LAMISIESDKDQYTSKMRGSLAIGIIEIATIFKI